MRRLLGMVRRRLPHIYPEGRWLFITWRLQAPSRRFLRQEAVAKLVVEFLQQGVNMGHYGLGPWVIMPDHVHALLLPQMNASKILQWVKGTSAREVNRVLGRTGEPFWQKESYDHWVRSEREWRQIAAYIEENPVKAGIVEKAEDYRWSSASQPEACVTQR